MGRTPPRPSTSRFSEDEHFNLVDEHINHIVTDHLKAFAQIIEQQREAINTLINRDQELRIHVERLEQTMRIMPSAVVSTPHVPAVVKEDGDDRRKRMLEKIRGTK